MPTKLVHCHQRKQHPQVDIFTKRFFSAPLIESFWYFAYAYPTETNPEACPYQLPEIIPEILKPKSCFVDLFYN